MRRYATTVCGVVDTLTFREAVEDDNTRTGGRSVLLGNGFSIDWNPGIFAYRSLYDEADLKDLSVAKDQLFSTLKTHDFEFVIEHLKSAAALLELHGGDAAIVDALKSDARVVRNGLADVLTARHPRAASEVSEDEYTHARTFLAEFGRIFTLNYDLLLYWVVNHMESAAPKPQRADGFEWPSFDDRPYLVWKRGAAERSQRVFWLHGALHLFVNDHRLRKLNYSLAAPLIEQVTDRLAAGKYPLVVTEGTAEEKLSRIELSGYLRFAHNSLSQLTGSLFVHGWSLSRSDDHIAAMIASRDSSIEAVYVGLHKPRSDAAEELAKDWRRLARRRRDAGGRRLTVKFYDAATAEVWRPAPRRASR